MRKKEQLLYKILLLCFISFSTSSCEDFLDREPQDFLSEDAYFNQASDLGLFVNKFYSSFKVNADYGRKSLYAVDNNSDNQIGPWEEENLLEGYKLVPPAAGKTLSDWNFSEIRECNYFIQTVEERIKSGILDATNTDVMQYTGENYFFRAWFYFNKLQAFGDFPIITKVLSDDTDELIAESKRMPRNEVARFILQDLEKAISLLDNKQLGNRIGLSTAQLLASRVALFEGTWLKYHKGTAMVPGTTLWMGSKTHSNFVYQSGDIEKEIKYFLSKAVVFSKAVADKHKLSNNYPNIFVSTNLSSDDEVLLFKSYGIGTVLGHGASHYLQRTGAGCGFTRSYIETFLMKNGLPIYAINSNYKGDANLQNVVKDRDERLQYSMLSEGDVRIKKADGSMEFFTFPDITTGSGWQSVSSGYMIQKWMSTDPLQAISSSAGTTDCPIFRAAEAYLNYIESYYELNHSIDAKANEYWIALRSRANTDTDFQKTINNTDLTKENDFAVTSAGQLIDATLYNIRRERRCEFIAEGMRLFDLYRWRSLDNMKNYIVEGFNLWDENYLLYEEDLTEGGNVSFSPKNGGSKYFQPFRKVSTNRAFDGYTFSKPHYLSPIPLDQFALTNSTGDNGILYQNYGWSKISALPAK